MISSFARITARTPRRAPALLKQGHLRVYVPRAASRSLHASSSLKAAGLDNIYADEELPPVAVKSIGSTGIELQDGLVLRSACIFSEGRVFLWDVPPAKQHGVWDGWTKDHFQVFDIIVPKPEILLLGTGDEAVLPPPFIREYLSSIGVQLDVMNTWNACSTYNLLTEEGRRVSAALLPSTHVPWKTLGKR